MDYKTKKQAIYCMIGVLVILLILLGISGIKKFNAKKKYVEFIKTQPVLVSFEKDSYAQEESQGDKEYEMTYDLQNEAPDRVMIENLDELAKAGLTINGLDYLEPYLTQYFDYYLQNGTNYYGKYVEDSFRSDYNFPSFTIYVEDLDLEIDCIYIIYQNLYRFTSRFNPDGK